MKKMLKNKDGITLISLVVTIIILLILAGISIAMLSGDNGLLNKAGQARDDTIVGGEKEQVELAYISAVAKNLGGNVTGKNLQDELDVSVGKNKTTVTGTSTLKVKFEDTQNVYKVSQDGKVEKKTNNPNLLEISELNENARTYFGWDVINYAETLPVIGEGNNKKDYTDTTWQLFYAGALDIDATTATALGLTEAERTEERIWLISKEYVKNTLLPAKNGVTPDAVSGSDYKANFGGPYGGLMYEYASGSGLVNQAKLKALNSDYFKEYSSTKINMKAVAYMLDTTVWGSFATSSEGYAEYAIGGPTVELLFTAYNKYTEETSNQTSYEADAVSTIGYEVRKTSSDSFTDAIVNGIADDVTTGTNIVDSPYSVSSLTSQADGYWLASPPHKSENSIFLCYKTR